MPSKLFPSILVALLVASSACGGDGRPEDRYDGPIAACEVELSETQPAADELEAARESVAPEFWKDGPYGVWNTSPAEACPGDPAIPGVGEERDVPLYITYPAAGVPTETGLGDVAPGEWPVIVFAHANNDRQCDIYRRYYSLHDHWASWGFVVVAVDGTHTNCRRGNKANIEERIAGQLAAVDTLEELDADPDSRFYGRLDLDQVVFAGHSRGGGASLVAAERHGDAAGVIDIQGIDLTAFGFGAQTLPDFPVVGLTAGEDVDLNYPIVEPTEDQLGGPYTWVNINGGIHAYTADTVPIEPDDEPLIERDQQHDVTEYYTTAFLARFVGLSEAGSTAAGAADTAADTVLFSHEGAEVVDRHISEMGVFQRWRSPGEVVWIDRFDDSSPDRNLTGGQNISDGLTRSEVVATYQPDQPRPGSVYAKATSRLLGADDSGTFRLELDDVTVPSAGSLQARIKGPDDGDIAELTVRVVLADGTVLALRDAGSTDNIGPEPLSNRFTQLVKGVFAEEFAGRSISTISFQVSGGSIFIDDVRLVIEEP